MFSPKFPTRVHARSAAGLARAAREADRLAKAMFDSIASLPAPEHLVGLADELDVRFPHPRAA